MPTPKPALEEILRNEAQKRFWNFVTVSSNDACWPWKGPHSGRGYGRLSIYGTSFAAHRASLIIRGMDIPPGMVVDHICRNPSCVNPSHLRVVTPRVNSLENSISPAAINWNKTHCNRGHLFTRSALRDGGKRRICNECSKIYDAKYAEKLRKAGRRRLSDAPPEDPAARHERIKAFLLRRVKVGTDAECWMFEGVKNKKGYGLTPKPFCGENFAHRLSWRVFRGEIPKGLFVCHKCKKRACVNPGHLFLTANAPAHRLLAATGTPSEGE